MKIRNLFVMILAFAAEVQAAPVLNPLCSDHAMLQNHAPPTWRPATAKSGEKNPVFLGEHSVRTIADSQEQWRVEFPPSTANQNGIQLEVCGEEGEPVRVSDLIFGDVYLLGGKSNRRHAFKTYPILKETTKSIGNSALRITIVNHEAALSISANNPTEARSPFFHPLFKEPWQSACNPLIDCFSPIGYCFFATIRSGLQVPLDLFLSAVGSTMNLESLSDKILQFRVSL